MSASAFQVQFPLSKTRKIPVVGAFDAGAVSSDGGLILLRQIDAKIGLVQRLAQRLNDPRQQSKVKQSVEDMVRQRVFGICLGYEDCNDFDTLCADPAFKVAAGRLPVTGADLASQPTLCRFENSVGRKELRALMGAMVEQFIAAHPTASRIVLDFDATDDPTHGQQELEFFHGYYGCHCYLPLLVFATVDDKPEQHLICAVLRPGNKHAGHRTVSVLKRIVKRVREVYPQVSLTLRGDAGFASPEVYDYCEKAEVDYVLSLARNKRLEAMAEPILTMARAQCAETGQKSRLFDEVSYAAESWPHERRVIVKAEVMPKFGDNPRFVVTNIARFQVDADAVYEFYTRRGDVENRIKEVKNDLAADRTSCHRFVANQFRLILHAAAMQLMQALRGLLAGTEMARLQSGTLRVKLLKVGVRVVQSCRRIWLGLPTSYPYQTLWEKIWQRLTEQPAPAIQTAS